VLETANALSRPVWRERAVSLVNHLAARADVEIVPFSSALWSKGWKLFGQRPDKSWSLTDCISFEVMLERGLTEALSADSHFAQAGFRALLIDS
jgi:predicted nucleic acid-binding protein